MDFTALMMWTTSFILTWPLTFIWPWPTKSYFSIMISFIDGFYSTYDVNNMFHFIWPWHLDIYMIFQFCFNCHNFFIYLWMLLILRQSYTCDLTDMLDDFYMTLPFLWPWPTRSDFLNFALIVITFSFIYGFNS